METETKKRRGILRWFAVLMAIFIAAGTVFGMTQMGGDSVVYAAEGTWIYVDGANGNDSNNGSSAGSAVKSWGKAQELLGYNGGGIYVVGTVTAEGQISTNKPKTQSVKRADGFEGVMFEVPENATATFANIDVDGEDRAIDGQVIKPNRGAKLNFLEGAVFHNIGYDGWTQNKPTDLKGGVVSSLTFDVIVLVDGAEFCDNKGKGIFISPLHSNTEGTVGGEGLGVHVTMKSGKVTNNKGWFYFNEVTDTTDNTITIYNALVKNNDASNVPQRYTDYTGRTGVIYVCNEGLQKFRSIDSSAIYDNTSYDLMYGDKYGNNDRTVFQGTALTDPQGSFKMLGGGNANWGSPIDAGNKYYAYKSNPSQQDKETAEPLATSIFTNNGAIIDSNGLVQFGRYSNEKPPETPSVPDAPTPGTEEEEEEEEPEPQPEEPTTPAGEELNTQGGTAITVIKTVDGEKPGDKVFDFELYARTEAGDIIGEVLQTKQNDADGNVVFDAMNYAESGTYRYAVKEKVPADATDNGDGTFTKDGMVYDAAQKNVDVNVTVNYKETTEFDNVEDPNLTYNENSSNHGDGSVTPWIIPEGDWNNLDPTKSDVRLQPTKDSETGEVINRVQMYVDDAQGNTVVRYSSDENGFSAFLKAGKYKLYGFKNGYVVDTVEFVVPESTQQPSTAVTNSTGRKYSGTGEEVNYEYKGSSLFVKDDPFKKADGEYVYCIQWNLEPHSDAKTRNANKRYRYHLGENTWLLSNTLEKNRRNQSNSGPRDTGTAKQMMERVLYYGFPNNGLKANTLSDEDYYDVTQSAINYAVNNVDASAYRPLTSAKAAVYDQLVQQANNGSIPNGVGYDLYIYASDNGENQNLIGGNFYGGNGKKIKVPISSSAAKAKGEKTVTAEAGSVTVANSTVEYNGSLKTQVKVNGNTAAENAAYRASAGSNRVNDVIKYTDLQPNAWYKLYAELYKVGDDYVVDKIAGPNNMFAETKSEKIFIKSRTDANAEWKEANAEQKKTAINRFNNRASQGTEEIEWSEVKDLDEKLGTTFVKSKQAQNKQASTDGNGNWEMTFSEVTLEAGATYVVFEYAENVNDSKDKAEHHDAGDLSQTIIVEDGGGGANEYGSILIRKVDSEGNKLEGAHLKLMKGEDLIEEWDSFSGEEVVKNLIPGTYTLVEVDTPDNTKYQKADPIEFEVEADNWTADYAGDRNGIIGYNDKTVKNNDNDVAEAFCVTIDAAFDNGSSYTKVYDVEFDTLGNNPAGVNDPRKEKIARIMYAYMNDEATLVSKLGTASFEKAGVYIGTQMAIHNVLDQHYQRFNDNHDIGSVNALMTYLVEVANNADAPKSDLIYLKPNDTANSQSLVLAKEIPGITMVDEEAAAPVEIQLTGKKAITADEGVTAPSPVNGQFKFELIDKDNNDKVLDSIWNGGNNGNLRRNFKLNFTEAGTYHYQVREVGEKQENVDDSNYEGISFTAEPVDVTVEVKENTTTNKLEAYVNGGTDAVTVFDLGTFENRYEEEPPVTASLNIKAKKVLVNENDEPLALKGGEFTFQLLDWRGTPIDGKTAQNDADGNVDFGEFEWTQAGTFGYSVIEVAPENATKVNDTTYIKDGIEYTISAQKANVSVDAGMNATQVSVPEIRNKKTPVVAKVNITAKKSYKDAAGGDIQLQGGEFTFRLLDWKQRPIEGKTASNDADGNIDFGEFEYTQEGAFGYFIQEVAPEGAKSLGNNKFEKDGITYDCTPVRANVTVTKNADGSLTAARTEGVVISNDKKATPAKAVIEAEKSYKNSETGEAIALEGGEFTFELSGSDIKTQEKTNDDQGKVSFDEIEYTEAGTYTYIVKETSSGDPTITYDTEERTVEVKVEKDGTELKVTSITYTSDKKETFENKYTEPEGPSIGTTAKDGAQDGDKTVVAETQATVKDVVKYYNLEGGKEYTVTGKLMNKKTGKEFKVNGKTVTATETFTADASGNGSEELTFTFDASALNTGDRLVVFESVSEDGTEVAAHADINDEAQTVEFVKPDAKTTASDAEDGDKIVGVAGTVTVKDIVKYTNLTVGKEYTLDGKLVTKSSNGERVVAEVTGHKFTPATANGEKEITFTVNTLDLAGEKLVAFETVKYEGVDVVVHANINDGDQTVEVQNPEIGTKATDVADGDAKVVAETKQQVKDVVEYKNLIPGKTYTMSGELIKKSDGRTVLATSFTKFVADESGKGTVELVFTFNASKLAGDSAVAFETCKYGDDVIATHADIDDRDQTVEIIKPDAKTTATDAEDGDKVLEADETVTVKDVVVYTNLTPGRKYTLTGQLVRKSDGSEVEGATASTTFTADKSGNGTVELTFTVNAIELQGEKLVAFETVKYGKTNVVVHADINDQAQTVEVKKPEVKTTATDAADGDKQATAQPDVVIKDVVEYKNLKPNTEYTMSGKLVKKSDGSETGAVAEKTFISSATGNGTVELTFTIDATQLGGDAVVAFETCTSGDNEIAVHADINDAAQTVDIVKPEAKTNATDKADGDHTVKPARNVTVVDRVTYTNLIPGKEYTVKGTLHDKATGEACTFEGAAAEKTFTAAQANGFVDLEFTFDASALEGKSVVAFEKVEYNGTVIATHEDINDKAQTVEVKGEKVKVNVTKTWENADESTPVSVQLKKNGNNEGAVVTLNSDNEWKKEWTELPKEDADGNAYTYTVEENIPAGYYQTAYSSNTDDDGNVTVTYKNAKTPTPVVVETSVKVNVVKNWADGATPVAVDVQLYKDGTAEGRPVTLTEAAAWKYSWTGLESGHNYEAKEIVPEGYYQSATSANSVTDGVGNVEKTYIFTNDEIPEKPVVPEINTTASISADSKTITDVVTYTGLDTEKTYTLTGKLMDKATQKEVDASYYTVAPVTVNPEAADGTAEMVFTLTEAGLEALKGKSIVVYEKLTTTETAENGTTEEKEVAKHEDITSEDQTVDVPEDETHEVKINKTDMGGTEVEGATITVTDAAGKKVDTWVSKANETMDIVVKAGDYKLVENTAPAGYQRVTTTIEFTVTDEGKVTVNTTEVEPAGACVYENGVLILKDAIEETPVTPEIKIATKAELGAKSAITEDGTTTGVITQILDTVSYEGLETGKTYKLVGKLMDKATQNEVDANYYTCSATEVKPTAANGTALMIFDLTKEGARALSGREIVVYEKLFEVKVNDDNTTTEEEVAKHEDITDKNQTVKVPEKENPTVEISKTAVADSAELPGAKLIITKKGSEEIVAQHTSTKQTWKVKLEPGEYTLTEITAPKGYEVAESIDFTVNENGLAGGGKVHMEDAPTPEEPKPEITEVTVNKVWDDNNNQDGKRTENVTVNLLADGTAVAKYVLNSSNNWTHTFTALPKKNAEGKDFVYTVVETEVPAGYEAAVNGFTITNKHTPETVTITGTKTWNDADNQYGKRPAGITVNLLANGTVKDSKTVTQKDNWTYTWKDLPKYENGSEIKYTVTENKVEGYQVTSDGINIINNYTPGKTSVSVVKAWADENDKDAIRPASVSATLYADGATVDTQVLSADNGWTYTWTDLDEMKDGKTIVYTVDEAVVPEGYGKAVTENNGTFVITNTHTPSKEEKENPTVTISKTDAATSAELPGATLIIKNKAGETVVTFVSGDEPTKFQLEPGEYTLTEVTAPKGYEVAETISFTVDANGLVGSDKVEMKDAPIVEEENPTVTISKTDAATTAELPGATLIIRNAEGKIVESFVSGSEPTLVQLAPGEYTLTELTAPQGYQVAETISFTVDANGLVGSDKVEMKDAPIEKEEKEGKLATTVHANGTVASNAAAAEIDLQAKDGAVNVVDYIVYTDLKGGVTYAVTGQLMKIVDGKAVEVVAERTYDYTADASGNGEWVMVIGDVTVEQDTKYVVFETAVEKNVAEGETPETIEHKDANDTAQTVVVKPYVEGTEVEISKQDATTKEELPGAQLIVKDASGAIVAEWTSGTTPHMITLKPGNYTLTEITAPDGYLKAETIAFTVDESGLVGSEKVVMLDDKASNQNVKNSIGTEVTAEKVWTTEWPEGVNVTFTLQYFADGEWKTYYKDTDVPYTVTIAKGEIAVFENLPFQINEVTAKYRVVEDAVDGYNVKEWKATDFDNLDGTMSVTNQPNGGKQETTPGESTDKEQTTNNENPSSETGEENPQNNNNDNNNNDKNNNNGGDNNTGVITPAPGRTTSGGYPTTPVTTRRTGTYATSTPSVSSSTATSTGDTNNAALWIVLAAAASAAIAGAAFGISRRRRHEG